MPTCLQMSFAFFFRASLTTASAPSSLRPGLASMSLGMSVDTRILYVHLFHFASGLYEFVDFTIIGNEFYYHIKNVISNCPHAYPLF